MKLLLGLAMVIAASYAFPEPPVQGGEGGGGKEGAFFTNEAIRQAQNTHLIPQGATIQKVQEGIELAAYESIPGDQRINLFEILGDHVPPEVVNNLQTQVDQVGKAR
ncbi:uncharacterized protein [Halyomorpha halys]|uniref:uncharacterized protein n=1 Tax=Halyomorpha halys TaxID=286706 RepID=UPI0006D4DF01|nr:uncharacterized protein LOC106684416 [Halyomorpha halys]